MFELMMVLTIASPTPPITLPASAMPTLYGARANWVRQADPSTPAAALVQTGARGARLGARDGVKHFGRVGSRRGSVADDGLKPEIVGPIDPRDRFEANTDRLTHNQ